MSPWMRSDDDGWKENFSSDEDEIEEEETSCDDDDQEPTIDCPYCGEEIHGDAQQCPKCGHYMSEEDAPPSRKPLWFVLGLISALAIVAMWLMMIV